ncbi:hypothetical protein J1N35_010196, partial [Gossypium stocksii]
MAALLILYLANPTRSTSFSNSHIVRNESYPAFTFAFVLGTGFPDCKIQQYDRQLVTNSLIPEVLNMNSPALDEPILGFLLAVAISVSMTACNAMISPSSFRTSKPVADLYDCRSNAVSKWIATLLLLHTYWVFPVELR